MYSYPESPRSDPLSYGITQVLMRLGIEPGIEREGPYFAVPVQGLNVLAQHVTMTDKNGGLVEAARVFEEPLPGFEGAVHRAGRRRLDDAARILQHTYGYGRVIRT